MLEDSVAYDDFAEPIKVSGIVFNLQQLKESASWQLGESERTSSSIIMTIPSPGTSLMWSCMSESTVLLIGQLESLLLYS